MRHFFTKMNQDEGHTWMKDTLDLKYSEKNKKECVLVAKKTEGQLHSGLWKQQVNHIIMWTR